MIGIDPENVGNVAPKRLSHRFNKKAILWAHLPLYDQYWCNPWASELMLDAMVQLRMICSRVLWANWTSEGGERVQAATAAASIGDAIPNATPRTFSRNLTELGPLKRRR